MFEMQGVVGLAIARQLALDGHAVTVVEAEPRPGRHTSGRNSEILHAGIYYPPGSLKARLCVKGRKMLYAYCRANGVPHNRTGKLLVATSEEQVNPTCMLQTCASLLLIGRLQAAETS